MLVFDSLFEALDPVLHRCCRLLYDLMLEAIHRFELLKLHVNVSPGFTQCAKALRVLLEVLVD